MPARLPSLAFTRVSDPAPPLATQMWLPSNARRRVWGQGFGVQVRAAVAVCLAISRAMASRDSRVPLWCRTTPEYGKRVLAAYRSGKLSAARTIELLWGTVGIEDLPEQRAIPLESLRREFDPLS